MSDLFHEDIDPQLDLVFEYLNICLNASFPKIEEPVD